MICKKHNKEFNSFLSACPECMKEKKKTCYYQKKYQSSLDTKTSALILGVLVSTIIALWKYILY